MNTQTQTTSLPTKSELLEFFKSLGPAELTALDHLLLSVSEPWLPLPGPQTIAFRSLADELFYGGAAGGGKTDLLIGAAATAHTRSIIFRRETTQTKGVEERLMELLVTGQWPYRAHGNYNKTDKEFWSQDRGGYKIFLAGVKDPGDEQKHQGRPHDLKAFDELTHFTQYQYVYLNTWKRSSKPGQRTRTIAASNPPTDEHGMWVIDYWAPWLDPNYLGVRPKIGELRYYITDQNGKTYEVESHERVKYNGRFYEPKSRTFIPSSVRDNIYYEGTGYEAQLAMLPDELRAKFLDGDFTAGIVTDPQQLIPRSWVELAQARWKARTPPTRPYTSLGVDVARGGKDEMITAPCTGNYVHPLITFPVNVHKSGISAARALANLMTHKGTIANIDLLGVGGSVVDHLELLRPGKVQPMNASESPGEVTDKSGLLTFVNCRSYWHWKVREMLDPVTGQDIALPPDPELLRQLCAIKWKSLRSGIQIEAKDEIKKRLGRSPDHADAVIYALNDGVGNGMGLLRHLQVESGEYNERVAAEAKEKQPVIIIGSKPR